MLLQVADGRIDLVGAFFRRSERAMFIRRLIHFGIAVGLPEPVIVQRPDVQPALCQRSHQRAAGRERIIRIAGYRNRGTRKNENHGPYGFWRPAGSVS
jgi:hypothetical protein